MSIKLAVATAAAMALSAPAFAAYEISDTAKVEYKDLDLTTESGVAQLDRRVRRAAEQVCGYMPPRGLTEQLHVSECQSEIVALANAELQPALASAGRSDVRLAASLVRRAR